MLERELPRFCSIGEHQFAPSDLTVTPTCGSFSGADVYMEVMVIMSSPGKDYQPHEGDVCQKCFQIYGVFPPERDEHLVKIFQDLSSWENCR